jgi:NAD(P)-dependent dehydrogenase (short-subunit alcohol dehydrogenase family)
VLEEFGRVIAPGGAGIVISSMAGHMFPPFASGQERARPHADRRAACPAVPQPRGHGRRRLRLRQARQPPAGRGRKPRATGRVGTPDEVAAAAAFLVGPEAGFITGSDLLMDGGVIAALRAGRWSLAA